jgi:hypothetical protein
MQSGGMPEVAMIRKTLLLSSLTLVLLLSACGSSSSGPSNSTASSQSGSPDQVAQQDLQTALAGAKAQYRQTGNFSQAAPPELQQFAAGITFVEPDGDVTAGTHQVGVSNGGDNTNQTVTLAAVSSSGTCWYLVDVAKSGSETLTGPSGIRSPGIWYGHANNSATTCNAPDNGPPGASSLAGGWGDSNF